MTERVPRILVVDDVVPILDYCARATSTMPPGEVVVETESDPRRAIERLRAGVFRAVITDHRMPHVTGLDVLAAARQNDPETRRVLMTGYNELPASADEVRAADVDAYVFKPVPAQALLLLVRDLLASDPGVRESLRRDARDWERATNLVPRPAASGIPAVIARPHSSDVAASRAGGGT